jgi:hypothetical protein
MAQSATEDAKRVNVSAATINQFARELDEAEDKVTTAVGVVRSIRKRAKNDGVNLRALDEVRKAKRMDEDEVLLNEQDRLRYAAFLGLDLGTQLELDVEIPEEVKDERAKYDAERDGYNFGKSGHPRTDNPFEAGTVAYVAWDGGWTRGEKEHFEGPTEAPKKRGRPKKGVGAEMGDAGETTH